MNPLTCVNEHLQEKMIGLKGELCDSTGHSTASKIRFFLCYYVLFVYLLCLVFAFLSNFVLFCGKGCRGKLLKAGYVG